MQTQNPFLDELAKLTTAAMGIAQAAGDEAKTALRAQAGTCDMSVAILDFLLGHEDLLLRFCEVDGVSPKDLHLARHRLGGGEG